VVSDESHRYALLLRVGLGSRQLLSEEHFTVDGTLIQAWANRRSFREKPDPPSRGTGTRGSRWLRL
jgi:transposase